MRISGFLIAQTLNFFVFIQPTVCQSNMTIWWKLESFYNELGTKQSGLPCQNILGANPAILCNTYFKIGIRITLPNKPLYTSDQQTTMVFYNQSSVGSLSPLSFTLQSDYLQPNAILEYVVTVFHKSTSTLNDDQIYQHINNDTTLFFQNLPLGYNATQPTLQTQIQSQKLNGKWIHSKLWATCNAFYYQNLCQTICKESNSSSMFCSCDKQGNQICNTYTTESSSNTLLPESYDGRIDALLKLAIVITFFTIATFLMILIALIIREIIRRRTKSPPLIGRLSQQENFKLETDYNESNEHRGPQSNAESKPTPLYLAVKPAKPQKPVKINKAYTCNETDESDQNADAQEEVDAVDDNENNDDNDEDEDKEYYNTKKERYVNERRAKNTNQKSLQESYVHMKNITKVNRS